MPHNEASIPNSYTVRCIISSIRAQVSNVIGCMTLPCTELDSHANMVVLGKNSFIFESSGKTCNVKPFTDEIGIAENVPIVDGAIAYDDSKTGKTYILLVRNALYIPTMETNLIPPFIMRMRGVIVKDVPKIHCVNPTIEDHSISFDGIPLRIQLHLNGIFSVFHSRAPQRDELQQCDKVFLTPDAASWNPHCDSFAKNEESMMDFEGNIAEPNRRTRFIMEPDRHDDLMPEVSALDWNAALDENVCTSFQEDKSDFDSGEVNEFANAINLRGEESRMFASIGSCNVGKVGTDEVFITQPYFTTLDELEEKFSKDLSPTISAAHADLPKGVNKEVWQNYGVSAKKMHLGQLSITLN